MSDDAPFFSLCFLILTPWGILLVARVFTYNNKLAFLLHTRSAVYYPTCHLHVIP